LSFFFGILAFMMCWEFLAPRRRLTTPRKKRWLINLTITLLNVVILRWLPAILPLGMAILAKERSWGLLNNVELPFWSATLIGFILLDFAIYIQHVVFHAIPLLWRFHMVHHADLDFDVTTGLRFHPVEMLISLGLKLSLVALLGPNTLAVFLFEIVLNATSMFNHSNIRLPSTVDKLLRYFVVTPDMHRVHHSVIIQETNSNFGFNLSWWDRLFGTYLSQPSSGHESMEIGLTQFREASFLGLKRVLILPFVGKIGEYALNQRKDDSYS
jgi:sterol desaturase/sphingolipid hydroxylase (fatty acid hydroxylase superfamily)